jgi:hypothetical protein
MSNMTYVTFAYKQILNWENMWVCKYFIINQYNNGHFKTHMHVLHSQPKKPMRLLGMQCGYWRATILKNVV